MTEITRFYLLESLWTESFSKQASGITTNMLVVPICFSQVESTVSW
ncbi:MULTISPECIES: hypothetical protein [Nostocales]|nr:MULTISPECIES: hypothetical protein [Nostocales]MBO1063305.1 hypothetical protein [Anabaena sp. 54]